MRDPVGRAHIEKTEDRAPPKGARPNRCFPPRSVRAHHVAEHLPPHHEAAAGQVDARRSGRPPNRQSLLQLRIRCLKGHRASGGDLPPDLHRGPGADFLARGATAHIAHAPQDAVRIHSGPHEAMVEAREGLEVDKSEDRAPSHRTCERPMRRLAQDLKRPPHRTRAGV